MDSNEKAFPFYFLPGNEKLLINVLVFGVEEESWAREGLCLG